MTDQIDAPRTRRALLTAALGAGAATVASAITRPLPANAADGVPVLVGGEYVADTVTKFDVAPSGQTALWGVSGGGYGVVGTSANLAGVGGQSNASYGVHGTSATSSGVFGFSLSGVGVEGYGQESHGLLGTSLATDKAAVLGRSDGDSTGVIGKSGSGALASPAKTGIYGYANQDATAVGMKGESGLGIGVVAATTTGTALQVVGKAKFSRSGKASILANAKYVDVTVPGGLTANSVVHATIQTYRSGVSIVAARPNWPTAGKARIYINKVASTTSSTPVGWFVAEY